MKAERNLRLHGISFETAREVLADSFVIATENYYITDQGEQRWQAIGMASNLLLLLVVFVDRAEDGGDHSHRFS